MGNRDQDSSAGLPVVTHRYDALQLVEVLHGIVGEDQDTIRLTALHDIVQGYSLVLQYNFERYRIAIEGMDSPRVRTQSMVLALQALFGSSLTEDQIRTLRLILEPKHFGDSVMLVVERGAVTGVYLHQGQPWP